MSAAEKNREALKAIYDHFFAGDVAAMATYLRDDAVIYEAETLPYGGEYTGPQGLHDVLSRVMGTWSDVSFEIAHFLASDKAAAAFGTFHVTSRDTGKKTSFKLCEVWEFEDGKVTSVSPVYGDTALALRALGQA